MNVDDDFLMFANDLLVECDEILKFIAEEGREVDRKISILQPLWQLQSVAQDFIDNIASLRFAVNGIVDDGKDFDFLKGIILAGLISAYEGFVRSLIVRFLEEDDLMVVALDRINALDERSRKTLISILKIRNKSFVFSSETLRSKLDRVTLNNPVISTNFLKLFFGFEVQILSKKDFYQLIEIRNSYIHRGGVDSEKISLQSLNYFFEIYDKHARDVLLGFNMFFINRVN